VACVQSHTDAQNLDHTTRAAKHVAVRAVVPSANVSHKPCNIKAMTRKQCEAAGEQLPLSWLSCHRTGSRAGPRTAQLEWQQWPLQSGCLQPGLSTIQSGRASEATIQAAKEPSQRPWKRSCQCFLRIQSPGLRQLLGPHPFAAPAHKAWLELSVEKLHKQGPVRMRDGEVPCRGIKRAEAEHA